MPKTEFYHWQDDTLILQVYIQPRASKDEIVGLHDNQLKIRITAPPVDGKANAHIRKFLARTFKVPQARIILSKGEHSRHKEFQIQSPQILITELTL